MLFLSDRFTSASGSIGGTTFSHNRFGMYTRARRMPVNPNTASQQDARNAFASGSAAWRDLTEAQRDAWDVYAAATPVTNRLGQTVFLTGQQQFVASYSLVTRLGGTAPADGPTTPGRQPIGTPTVVIDASTPSFVASGLDAALDTGRVGAFVGPPQSAGVAFFAGPYQLIGSAEPLAGVLTINAAAGRNGQAFASGQIIPYRLAGHDADNRLSTIASGFAVVQA